ncbi:hypothetical protein [Mycolicibacterium mageritense]
MSIGAISFIGAVVDSAGMAGDAAAGIDIGNQVADDVVGDVDERGQQVADAVFVGSGQDISTAEVAEVVAEWKPVGQEVGVNWLGHKVVGGGHGLPFGVRDGQDRF